MKLAFCPHCQEASVEIKHYGEGARVAYCLNKGCGYRQALPDLNNATQRTASAKEYSNRRKPEREKMEKHWKR